MTRERAVDDEMLVDISNDLYGNPVYGQAANSILEYERRNSFKLPADEPIRTGRLDGYLRAHGLVDHQLHGTLGKSLDILNVAASSAKPHRLESYDPVAYIRWDRVFDKIATRAPKLQPADMRKTVDGMVWQQLHTGQPDRTGEMIFEGAFDQQATRWDWRRTTTQFVARTSLIAVAKTFNPRVTIRPILEEIAEL